jgi:hypothetical protein
MGFQMFAIIAVAVLGGIWLDKLVNWKFPFFTFIFIIAGVLLAVFYFIHDIQRFAGKK